ncbi:hypothetical protein ABMA27_010088 [Loxostege sticticalis]|uniref:Uncharacterized protein n=1 Tax=Loxostege sticticalis TaxID=481309 RepID=A0ABR3H4W0_LOXSC
MLEESEINMLVSNVLNECRFSHCRLCLKQIEKEYVSFHDFVAIEATSSEPQTMSEFLREIFSSERELYDEIAGVDAVCLNCVDKTFELMKFMKMCRSSSKLLKNVFNHLTETLNNEIDTTNNQTLYVVVNEKESSLILVKKDDKEKENINSNASKQKRGRKRKHFDCSKCDEVLDNLEELKAHNLSFHNSVTCDICHEACPSNMDLEDHINTIHQYQCEQCSLRMDSEQELLDHIGKHHNTYVCKECGISCQGLDKLRVHEQKHISKSECPKCGKSYTTKEFYQRHVKLCLEDRLDPHPIRTEIVKTYFCELCGKGYSTPGGLRVHERFTHGNAKPHECEYCGKKFTAPSYLKTHMIKHTGEKNFKCDICGGKFVSKEALLYHTRRHTGEKPYSCKFCNERFVNASARAEHIKFKHVGPTLMCEICSHKFVTSHFLKQHMSRHHDPTSKLYVSRTLPADMPGDENKKIRSEKQNETTKFYAADSLAADMPDINMKKIKVENPY